MVPKTASLKGKTVALTRPTGQAQEAGELIKAKGGVPYYIPAIEIKPLRNPAPVKRFIAELQWGKVDYVIFMSTNGVKYLLSATESAKLANDLKNGLSKSYVIAVGPKTAEELKNIGIRVDLVPEKYSSEGLLECLKNKKLSGKTIRIPRTTSATPTLTDQLKALGADVEEVHVYESGLPLDESVKAKFLEDLLAGKIDAIVFGSGLSAKNIFKMLTEEQSMESLKSVIAKNVTVVAIGPTTAEALGGLGVQVDVMPKDYLFETALSALADYWSKK